MSFDFRALEKPRFTVEKSHPCPQFPLSRPGSASLNTQYARSPSSVHIRCMVHFGHVATGTHSRNGCACQDVSAKDRILPFLPPFVRNGPDSGAVFLGDSPGKPGFQPGSLCRTTGFGSLKPKKPELSVGKGMVHRG